MENDLKGHYFPYCQFCRHDGKCELRHHEFLGLPSQGQTDRTSYRSHEDVRWGLSIFQQGTTRGTCSGRIHETGSIFYPLGCECGTVLSSLTLTCLLGSGGMCGKFDPNIRGRMRLILAKRIARRKHIAFRNVSPDNLPPLDPEYRAVMER